MNNLGLRTWGRLKGTGQGAWLILTLGASYRKVRAQVEVEGREYAGSDCDCCST
jgi:hypothetical protein